MSGVSKVSYDLNCKEWQYYHKILHRIYDKSLLFFIINFHSYGGPPDMEKFVKFIINVCG